MSELNLKGVLSNAYGKSGGLFSILLLMKPSNIPMPTATPSYRISSFNVRASRMSEVICNHLVMYYQDLQSETPTTAKYIYCSKDNYFNIIFELSGL